MKRFLMAILTITSFVMVIVNSVSFIDVLLLNISTIASFFIIKDYPIKDNMGKYVVLATIWISVVFMPAYHIVVHILHIIDLNQVDYNRLSSYGIKCYIISIVAFFVISKMFKKQQPISISYNPHPVAPRFVYICFALLFFLSAFCFATGLGRMGGEAVQLPFHLSGIINLLRSKAVPIFFAALVEIHLLREGKVPRIFIVLYLIWTIFEMFVWMSKSTLIYYLLPAAYVFYAFYKPSVKRIARYLLPVIVLFMFLYPIIEVARTIEGESLSETLKEAKKISDSDDRENSLILTIINRVFMSGQLYAQDYSYINHDSLFDFSLLPALFLVGGSGRFQTLEIDGFAPTDPQSSGSTGLIDPMLHGGEGLSFIFIALYIWFAFVIDRLYLKGQYSIYVNLLLLLFNFCSLASVSVLYSPDGLQNMFAQLVPLYIVYLYVFKRRTVNNEGNVMHGE